MILGLRILGTRTQVENAPIAKNVAKSRFRFLQSEMFSDNVYVPESVLCLSLAAGKLGETYAAPSRATEPLAFACGHSSAEIV